MIQLFPRFACTYSIQYLCILVSVYSSDPSITTVLLPCLLSIHQFVRRFIFFLEFIHLSIQPCFVLSYYLPVSCIL